MTSSAHGFQPAMNRRGTLRLRWLIHARTTAALEAKGMANVQLQ